MGAFKKSWRYVILTKLGQHALKCLSKNAYGLDLTISKLCD